VLPVKVWDLWKAEDLAMCCHFSNLRPLSVDANRRKNGSYSKLELRLYKRLWRMKFSPKVKQLTFADQPECPF